MTQENDGPAHVAAGAALGKRGKNIPRDPFALELLPAPLSRFVGETAASLGCAPEFVALPALAVAGAAIGTTRAIRLKASWRECPVVWTCVVARSGTLKSPALDAAVEPLRAAQADALRDHAEAAATYKVDLLRHEEALKAWRRTGGRSEPPAEPQAPTAKRFVAADTTVEALAVLLLGNPRGLLCARDELAGWLRGLNQYKARGRGGDVEAWLEFWRAGTVVIDRKSAEPRTIYVPRAAVSLCGTVQPGVLADVLTADYFENGTAARLLVAQPPELRKRWSRRAPSIAARRGYDEMVRALLALEHAGGERGPEPVDLPLAPDAEATWAGWYDRHAARIASSATDNEAAALAKLEAYAARFALVFALAADAAARDVSAVAVRAGCQLADWFRGEALRVYDTLAGSGEHRAEQELLSLIKRLGGSVTPRELMRSSRAYRGSADDAEASLVALAKAGRGHCEITAPPGGVGRPALRFTLHEGGDGDAIAPNSGETGVVSPSPHGDDDGELPGCVDGESPPDDVLMRAVEAVDTEEVYDA